MCGAEIDDFPYDSPEILRLVKIIDLHIEAVYSSDGLIDELKYEEFLKACEAAELVTREGEGWRPTYRMELSGFTWLGKANDDLEKIIWNILKTIQLLGNAIPKPFAPVPGTNEFNLITRHNNEIPPQNYSPHRLLCSSINGVSRHEYNDIFRLSALSISLGIVTLTP